MTEQTENVFDSIENVAPQVVGFVAIGRNEGERLRRCLNSLPPTAPIVYVDSGSTDGSQQWSQRFGAEVVSLDLSSPFTAARARNAGFRRLLELAPDIKLVQFIDGDCELNLNWLPTATSFMKHNPNVAAAFGRRRERHPSHSVYNQLCDWEWEGPIGENLACGGDVMMRAFALNSVGGYRETLIAGEEPELCVRLRASGWRIFRLDAEMTLHDAALDRFTQWWKRTVRSGYAFAQGACLHGSLPERHWVWESRRAWIWGIGLPFVCVAGGFIWMPWGWASFAIYPAQILRQLFRESGDLHRRATIALFQVIGRFAEGLGQLQFWRDRIAGLKSALIEYK